MSGPGVPRRLRVLVVVDSLIKSGGAERMVADLTPALSRHGVDCEVAVLAGPHDLAPELEAAGIRVHRLPAAHRWALWRSLGELRRLVVSGGFDAVWGHLFFGNVNAALLKPLAPGLRVAWSLHTGSYRRFPPKGAWPRLRFELHKRLGLRLVDGISACSRHLAREYAEDLGWKVRDIPNPVAVEGLGPPPDAAGRAAVRARHGLPASFCFAAPGRLVEQKGHRVLLEALRLLAAEGADPFCAVVGEGPLRADLEAEARALGVSGRLKFLEPLPHAELMRLIASCDAAVIPSLWEPFGIAAAECLGLGIPTVVSGVAGLREVAGDGGAALEAAPADPAGLAREMGRLMRDAPLRAELSLRGRRRVAENFDTPLVAPRWAEFLFAAAGRAPDFARISPP